VLKAVALAMGVAVVVTGILGVMEPEGHHAVGSAYSAWRLILDINNCDIAPDDRGDLLDLHRSRIPEDHDLLMPGAFTDEG
jgi:hypothetical protein